MSPDQPESPEGIVNRTVDGVAEAQAYPGRPQLTGELPTIIQGGMGVAVSSWQLARSVASRGQLGLVSGTAIDVVQARRLADGDPGGHVREAMSHFPVPEIAQRVIDRFYIEGGRDPSKPYPAHEMPVVNPSRDQVELALVANFAELWLAKQANNGWVGVNYLEKIRIPSLYELAGAVLGGADFVVMGAGIPREIPVVLDLLAEGKPAPRSIVVLDGDDVDVTFDPTEFVPDGWPRRRPAFLAIVSSNTLATFLARNPANRPDGFVVELAVAGGHNAPPRDNSVRDELGQPVYGERDLVNFEKLASVGLPFWVAGGWAGPDKLVEAKEAGAVGVQVGTAFALCEESGMERGLREGLLAEALAGELVVRTDPLASPSGYPFKVAQAKGTVSEPEVYESRRRVCDLGYLRDACVDPQGNLDYRCPAEPRGAFIRKGGEAAELDERRCLCNGLMATAGLAQVRRGEPEPPIVTLGDDAIRVAQLLGSGTGTFAAADVISWILGPGN